MVREFIVGKSSSRLNLGRRATHLPVVSKASHGGTRDARLAAPAKRTQAENGPHWSPNTTYAGHPSKGSRRKSLKINGAPRRIRIPNLLIRSQQILVMHLWYNKNNSLV